MRPTWCSKKLIILALVAAIALTGCSPSGLLVTTNPVVAQNNQTNTAASSALLAATPSTVPVTAALSTAVQVATPGAVAVAAAPSAAALSQDQLLSEVYQKVNLSVVNVTFAQGSGSGFVYDDQGHIITNNHVVENAGKLWVTFADGTMVPATVVGTDPGSDLAVIQVEGQASRLHPVTLGDSESLRVGQLAAAIGNPFGLQGTLTAGIISALGRVLPEESSSFAIVDMVQTDVPINPGNSGGPLLDSQGRVIGVTTMILSQTGVSSGVGLAVPVATVKKVVPALIAQGHYSHPWLGISGGSITPALAESLSLPVQQGVLVESVVSGGPADRAGIRGASQRVRTGSQLQLTGGDIILEIDGVEVKSFDDLVGYLGRKTEVGQRVTLTVLRDGARQRIEATLEDRPAAA